MLTPERLAEIDERLKRSIPRGQVALTLDARDLRAEVERLRTLGPSKGDGGLGDARLEEIAANNAVGGLLSAEDVNELIRRVKYLEAEVERLRKELTELEDDTHNIGGHQV